MEFNDPPLPEEEKQETESVSVDVPTPSPHPEEFQPVSTPGRTLGIFFTIAVIAGLCLAVGFHLGKHSAGAATGTPTASVPSAPLTNAPKPSAAVGMTPSVPATPQPSQPATGLSSSASTTAPAGSANPSAPGSAASAAPKAAPAAAKAPPEMAQSIPASGHEFSVQVAAVTKQEDADALVNALRQKNYPVFVINNQPGDRFFHVQVGPFNSLADAEAMRARLAGDGYNPIVKK